MARKKRPHVATPDEVKITRDGDFAIIAYNDVNVETTQYRVGADRLARMSDEDILSIWNAGLATTEEEVARSRRDMTALLSGGNKLTAAIDTFPNAPNSPFVRVSGRMYTPMELAQLIGSHVGWDVTIEFRRPPELGPDSGR